MSAQRAEAAGIALALAALAVGAPAASAAPRVHEGVAATPVFQKTVRTDPTADPKVFATVELEPVATADTVLVVTHESGASWANDDCAPGDAGSCVTTSAEGGAYVVTVFAAGAGAAGTAGVELDGAAIVGAAVPFGGTILDVEVPAGEYAVHTIHVVDGADDTVLLAYDADWAPIEPADDRSFDEAAGAVYALSPGDRLVVGAYAPSTAGCTDVMINDCTAAVPEGGTCAGDADGDGLSDALEDELGTDAGDHDTDGDGLFDYYEVIGRRTEGGVEALRRYGADPRRRDLFIELDRTPGAAVPDADSIRNLAAVYKDLPNLSSPDGSTGIAIHADTGAPCPDLPGVCGDFGGVDVFFPETENNGVSKYVRDDDLVRARFAEPRRGLFHYAMLTVGGGGQSGVGTTTLWAQYSDPERLNPTVYIAHELGHSLGLQHWGDDVEGSRLNHKFAYPSLMNYAFQFRIPGKTCTRSRFSEGALPGLDPLSLTEQAVAPGADKSQLALWPAYYNIYGSDDVDFNRDGRIDTRQVVFDVTPAYLSYGGAGDWPDQVGGGPIRERVPSGGGALAVVPHDERGRHATVYAIVPFDHGGDVYPDIAVSTNTVGVDSAAWSDWGRGRSLPGGGAPWGEAAAAAFGSTIVAVFPGADGAPRFSFVDPDTASFGTWTPIPGWPSGLSMRQASAAVIDGRFTVVTRPLDGGDDVYLARLDASGQWSPWELLALPSWTTPGITEGPDGREYLAYAQRAGGSDGTIAFAHRPAGSTGEWTLVPNEIVVHYTGFDIDGLRPEDRTRINLVFVPYYAAGDPVPTPFTDGSGYLALYWNKGSAHEDGRGTWRPRRGYVGGFIDRDGPVLLAREVRWRAQSRWRVYLPHSMAVARRFIDVPLVFTGLGGDDSCFPTEPIYQPHSNGTPLASDAVHLDTDDAAIIAATMCTALYELDYGGGAECRCAGGPSASCAARLDSPEPDWPICEFDPTVAPP